MDYRQQQAAQLRAELFELQAKRMREDEVIAQKQSLYDLYTGTGQPPQPVPAALPLPVAPAKSGWTFGQVVGAVMLVMFSFFAGSAWVSAAKQHRAVDARESWYSGASMAPEFDR